ncbi:uncharacterized protein LOC130054959 [Ostrea edulis]|uniref:uncharacterized protein LOC130054959 n=1 Tax=Ostrea edulis TaxID=37623 RepID=UPI0024AEC6F2|nr:uncharacterized protein LOC130054959 [Ostrea edulis]
MLSAAEETLADLFIIAAHGGLPVPAKNCCDTTNFPPKKFEEAQYSLRKVAQQAMFDSGEEIVENTFSQDDSNYRLDSLEKHGIDSNELLVDENEEPPRGWRKYICCISPPKSQQKKEKTGFLSRLRHMFKCC